MLPGLTLPTAGASATSPPPSFTPSCPGGSKGGLYGGVPICSGSVPSSDGAKMDVDLTQRITGSGRRHPLIIMLHGFGNWKHEWESTNDQGDSADKYHWCATHGYYVLSYTARGFSDDGPSEEDNQPPTPGDPSGSTSFRAERTTSRVATTRSVTHSGSRR